MSSDIDLREYLIAANLKATHQRLVVLKAIKLCKNHPSADQIFEMIRPNAPTITLATIYKTLETFVEAGLIAKVSTKQGQMRYDPVLSNHGHIYCHNTNEIVDFYDEELNSIILDFFKSKKVKNLKIKNISLNINGDKIDISKDISIK